MAFLDVGAILLSSGKNGKPKRLFISLDKQRQKDGTYSTKNLVVLRDALTEYIENPSEYGVSLMIEKPETEIRRLADLGYIEEEDVEKRIEQLPESLKYKIKYVQDSK